MLTKCPECSAEISESAMQCPHCGKPLKKPERGIMGKIFLWLFYLFNLYMFGALVKAITAVANGSQAISEADKLGAFIGAGLGFSALLSLWVNGAIITGLLALVTRPQ